MKKLIILPIILLLISGCIKENKLEEKIIGTWESFGEQYQIYDENYDPEKEVQPYTLQLKKNNVAEFQMNDVKMNGTYEISEDNKINIILDYSIICELKEDILECQPPIGTMKKQG